MTNDIDNIANTLQQSLMQIITSVFTIIGVLFMMLTISPVLAVISVLVLPIAMVVTVLIARQSQRQFAAQWERTGTLTGHVEESHTGHNLVKVFGHQEDAIRRFDEENELLYQASFRAQFISGVIQPTMNFVSNLNYVAIAVIGAVLGELAAPEVEKTRTALGVGLGRDIAGKSVLLDLSLPDLDGVEVLRAIHEVEQDRLRAAKLLDVVP